MFTTLQVMLDSLTYTTLQETMDHTTTGSSGNRLVVYSFNMHLKVPIILIPGKIWSCCPRTHCPRCPCSPKTDCNSKKAAPCCPATRICKLPSSSSSSSSSCSSCSSAVLPACTCPCPPGSCPCPELLPAPSTSVPGGLQPEGLRIHSTNIFSTGTGNILQLRGSILGSILVTRLNTCYLIL